MVGWLRQNMANAMTVTYRGETKPLGTWLAADPWRQDFRQGADRRDRRARSRTTLRGTLSSLSRVRSEITNQTFDETVQAAIAQIATERATAVGTKVLTSLSLLDRNGHIVTEGEFANALLAALEGPDGKALNRSDMLIERDPGMLTWPPWHLEPSWLVVVAAALCHAGRLELGYPAGQVDACCFL